jgi:hypothetical protein
VDRIWLKIILLGRTLAATLSMVRAQGEPAQKLPARQANTASGKETFLKYCASYPAGYVSALVKFGRSLAAHGSLDVPVWGSRFKELDPVRDPTGQQHVDDVVAYVRSLQAK